MRQEVVLLENWNGLEELVHCTAQRGAGFAEGVKCEHVGHNAGKNVRVVLLSWPVGLAGSGALGVDAIQPEIALLVILFTSLNRDVVSNQLALDVEQGSKCRVDGKIHMVAGLFGDGIVKLGVGANTSIPERLNVSFVHEAQWWSRWRVGDLVSRRGVDITFVVNGEAPGRVMQRRFGCSGC